MNTVFEKPNTISISKFKAHCTEQLRFVEEKGITLEITRHGKTIAVAKPPHTEPAENGPMPLLGVGKGTATLSPEYDPHSSAFGEDEWEMNRE